MGILDVRLLGQFEAHLDGQPVAGFEHVKARELFCYLLLNRGKPVCREILASNLWADHYTTATSKKYLRKALWQLHTSLDAVLDAQSGDLLQIEQDCLKVNEVSFLRLDFAEFDRVYKLVKGRDGKLLNDQERNEIWGLVELYRGDLLEGHPYEWCFYENLRYRQIHLIMLDKLMESCEHLKQFEGALSLGNRILRHDPARECTHERMMRLYYLSGDRTGALRQFQRCAEALQDQLGISPSRQIQELLIRIKADDLVTGRMPEEPHSPTPNMRFVEDIVREANVQIRETIVVGGEQVASNGRFKATAASGS